MAGGEFLKLLKENRIPAYGIDRNKVMVASCRQRGLKVETGNAIQHLESLPNESLDSVFSSQFVEHLKPRELTICPQTLSTLGESFLMDSNSCEANTSRDIWLPAESEWLHEDRIRVLERVS